MPAEGPGRGGTAFACQEQCDETHRHSDDVGQHVPGVGEQRQRVDGQTDDDLENEEREEDDESDHHAADPPPRRAYLTAALRVAVRMAVTDSHG